jgi:DNA (cytosine-5)-methyltransferase 1
MFCGVGGSSWGARQAGVDVVAAFDIWDMAKRVYTENFPAASFFSGRIESLSARAVQEQIGKIDLIIASPECTNHGPAKGAKERDEKSRETALHVTRFASMLRPRWIVIENVPGMRSWPRYELFTGRLKHLGYHVREIVINAADHNVPQNRRRLFLVCDLEAEPVGMLPTSPHVRPAAEILDRSDAYAFSKLFSETRAEATLERAERAIGKVGKKEPFLIVYYGSDQAGGWQSLDVPLRTLTTLDRFAYVKPTRHGHVMRMLQVPELKAAMGMPKRFQIARGTRRDRIKLVGNAVCPPVMRSVIRNFVIRAA